MSSKDQETTEKVRNWWSTEIIDMRPGKIRIRGEDIEELIGNISFVQMIWLMLQESRFRRGSTSAGSSTGRLSGSWPAGLWRLLPQG